MADPPPTPLTNFISDWTLSCSFPYDLVADLVSPSDPKYLPQASVDENLDSFYASLGRIPSLTSI